MQFIFVIHVTAYTSFDCIKGTRINFSSLLDPPDRIFKGSQVFEERVRWIIFQLENIDTTSIWKIDVRLLLVIKEVNVLFQPVMLRHLKKGEQCRHFDRLKFFTSDKTFKIVILQAL